MNGTRWLGGVTAVAWFVLVGGLATTALVWRGVKQHEHDLARAVFDRWTIETEDGLSDRLRDYEQVLRGAAGLFSLSEPTPAQWHLFIANLDLNRYSPGIVAVAFAERVRGRELIEHVRRVATEGSADYIVTPAGDRVEYYPLVFVEPLIGRNRLGRGYDEYSEPVRRAAMERARDTAGPALSAQVTLVQDAPGPPHPGFMLFYPIYDDRLPHTTVDQRRHAVAGFACGAIHLDALLAGLLSARPPGIAFDIYDGDQRRPEMLAYDDDGVPNDPKGRSALFEADVKLVVAGRTWTMDIATTPAFELSVDRVPERLALVSGLTISLLAFGLLVTTEQKRASRAVVERRKTDEEIRQLAAVVDNSTDYIGMARLDGTVFYVNPAGLAMTGAAQAQVLEQSATSIIHDDSRRFVDGSMKIIRDRGGWNGETSLRHFATGAPIPCEMTAFLVRVSEDGAPICIAWVARDVSERQRLEGQLRQAQKMEAIGTLAGGIAHDFNNILGAILGYAELATTDAAGNDQVLNDLAQITAAGRRATDLVRQILAFSRQQERSRQHVQLGPIITEAVKLLRASLPASIELRTRIDPDAPVVFADPTQIHQAIMNLGTNAWYAMKDRAGVVEVTLSTFDANAAFVRARVDLSEGRHALVSVRDTGHGMDQATQDRIFEPFFTTKGPGEGTGLGLATVHGIMKTHDGAISVESRLGEGTTFHLYFPAIATGVIEERPPETAVPRGRGEHILFVDDEAMLVGWGTRALERLGYRVTGVTSPADALAAVRATPARFDLVVTDLTMPAMNGIQLAQSIRGIEPDLLCILTTGYSAEITAESVQRFGIDALILKPMTKQTLGEAVHRVLALTEVHK